jgi:DNA-binding response OmpR family regulator
MDARAPICPCCRRPLDEAVAVRDLVYIKVPPNSRVGARLLSILITAWPREISCSVLVEHVYASEPNGEPEWAEKSVQVTIGHLRRRLQAYGWTISDSRGGGYRLQRMAG